MKNSSMKIVREGQEAVRMVWGKWDALRVHTKEVATKTLTQFEEVMCLEESLSEALSSKEIIEEKTSLLKDEILVTSTQYFEMEKC